MPIITDIQFLNSDYMGYVIKVRLEAGDMLKNPTAFEESRQYYRDSVELDEVCLPFLIENSCLCCEDFGVRWSNREGSKNYETKAFIGKRILSLASISDNKVEQEYNSEVISMQTEDPENMDAADGQLTIFNQHNGYYEHDYISSYYSKNELRLSHGSL